MRALNRTTMAKKYPGQWVALKADRKTVIGAGKTAQQALTAARKKGYGEPVLTRMPRDIRSFVGTHGSR